MSLKTTNFSIGLDYGESKTVGLLNIPANSNYGFNFQLTDGTGSGKAQKIATLDTNVVNGAPVTHDLTALAGPFANVNFANLKLLLIENTSAPGGGNLEVGGAGANAFSAFVKDPTDILVIGPGESRPVLISALGLAVDATHKNLKVNASAGTVTYRMIAIGEGT